jgi:very-long-chain (3R)-3-hydroxyacyl-CoA dehydratase
MEKTAPFKARNDYLISYNAVSAIMWAAVLGWVVLTATIHGTGKVFANAANFTRMVQTLAALEIAHSLTGEGLICTGKPGLNES